MQRSLVLFLLSLLSVTFLWLQIYVLNNIEYNEKAVLELFPTLIRRRTVTNTSVNWRTGLWAFLQDFNDVCSKNRVTIFIIDPSSLQSILKEELQTNSDTRNIYESEKCLHLCHKNSISIGILEQHWDTHFPWYSNSKLKLCYQGEWESGTFLLHVLDDLRKKNIKISTSTGQDPRLVDLEKVSLSLIPLHFFLFRRKFVIHVTLFYERGVLGLWHGAISQQDLPSQDVFNGEKRQEILPAYENFRNESVLNRFSLKISTVDGLSVHLPSEIELFLKDLRESRFLSCNFKRAREFYSKYGDDESTEASTFRKRGKDVLQLAKIDLDNLGVRFWLSSGTCLGWFRQCNVISHGKDMDIGIWIKDYKRELIEEFQKDGIYLHHILGKVEDSFQMSFRTLDDIRLDIFFFYEEGTYMWNGGTQARTGAKFKYIFPNFSLCWTEFLEMKVRVPCETQAYVEANYGKSWAVPIKQWDWKKSPSNVIENGMWDKKDLPEVVQFFELQ